MTIISKGNDKNNEHFLDFSENLVGQKDLQLEKGKHKQRKIGSIEINCQTAICVHLSMIYLNLKLSKVRLFKK